MNPNLNGQNGAAADIPSSEFSGSRVDARRLARVRWRCRRGMLENDLILARFLDARGDAITEAEIAALDRLLELADDELWNLLSGRQEPEDLTVRPLLQVLRAA